MFTHHAVAYFVEDFTVEPIFLKDLEIESEVEKVEVARLSIADVRRIIVSAQSRPFRTNNKVLYIATGHIAIEAQNALLKILEDPPATTSFVLWLGRQVELLPTVQSRIQVQSDTVSLNSTTKDTFSDFMHLSVPERLAQIAEVYKQKDVVADRALYIGLVTYLQLRSSPLSAPKLAEVIVLQCLLTNPGASKKMLWEALAFALPVEQAAQ